MTIRQIYLNYMNEGKIGYKVDDGEEKILGGNPQEASDNLMKKIIELTDEGKGGITVSPKSNLEKDVLLSILNPMIHVMGGFEITNK